MKLKRYITGILRALGYLLLAGGFVLLTGAVSGKEKKVICRAIVPEILDSASIQFVTEQDIKDLLLKNEGNMLGMPLWRINTEKIEKDLMRYPYIRRVEAYKDVNGNLYIDITQRRAIVRIYRPGHPGFFVDDQGYILPFSRKYPVHILVAAGNIPVPFRINAFKTIRDLPDKSRILEVYRLARYIDSVPFWKAQIEEIYVTRDGEYTLTPRVGSHAIIFGDASDYREKFRKLWLFYTHALNNLGWNRYNIINLKFKNQIVCTRRNQ